MGEATEAVRHTHNLDPKAKAMLLAIARAIDAERPAPSHPELAELSVSSVPTVKRRLKTLEADGYLVVVEPAKGRRSARYALGAAVTGHVDPSSRRGVKRLTGHVEGSRRPVVPPTPPEREERPEPSSSKQAVEVRRTTNDNRSEGSDDAPKRAAAKPASAVDLPPEDFPDELRPHAKLVMKTLLEVAKANGAKKPTARALGYVLMQRPRKPLVKGARDYAAWSTGARRKHKDVVRGYANWLDREDDLAALEPLPGQEQLSMGAEPPRRRRGGGIQSGDFTAALARRQARERGEG